MATPHIFKNFSAIGDSCSPTENAQDFLGLPHWYEYLSGERDAFDRCVPSFSIDNLNDIWLIGLAGIDILLRIVALVAIGFVIWGGFQYMTSVGEPDKTKAAKDTIVNALIGATIAIVAASVVSFIGNSIN